MRAPHALLVALGLATLLHAAPAWATPPITEAWQRRPPEGAAGDTSRAAVARSASSTAFNTTNTGVLVGIVCMLGGAGAQSATTVLLGTAALGVGVIVGPSVGWSRAGYQGRAAVGVLVRVGVIGAGMAVPLASREVRESELGGLAVLAGGLTGLAVAMIEGYVECAQVGPFVRQHGPGPAAVGLAPSLSPSGAPALALVVRFN